MVSLLRSRGKFGSSSLPVGHADRRHVEDDHAENGGVKPPVAHNIEAHTADRQCHFVGAHSAWHLHTALCIPAADREVNT